MAFEGFVGLHGDEIALFKEHLEGVEGVAVEIGSLDGFSAHIILKHSELQLTAIDPIIPDSMEPSLIGNADMILENTKEYGERFTFIQDYSYNVSSSFTYPLDFLFIDGDHSYDGCLKDFHQWAPKVKVGGILAMHDSRMGRPGGANFHEGPSKVAKELLYGQPGRWEIIGEGFSLTMARKISSQ